MTEELWFKTVAKLHKERVLAGAERQKVINKQLSRLYDLRFGR